jgi:integrase
MADAGSAYLTPLGERSLREVDEAIAADQGLPAHRRTCWRRALGRLARYLGKDLSHIPARPTALRHGLDQLDWSAFEISRKTVQNLRSEIKAILRHVGTADFPNTRGLPLAPAWRVLWDRLLSDRHRRGLGRFARYCSAKGIAPTAVDDEVVATFIEAAEKGGFVRKPGNLHRQVCRAWNECVDHVDNWPQKRLAVPDNRRPARSIPWGAFPASFREDVEIYLTWLSGKNLLRSDAPARPCKPSTLATRRRYIQLAASAADRGGVSIEDLRTLSDLVTPETALIVLEQYLAESKDDQPTTFVIDLSGLLVSIAAHWAGKSAAEIDELKRYRRRLERHRKPGLTPKNLALIRKVKDPSIRQRLQSLPESLMQKALAEKSALHMAAVLAELAAASEILLVAPMRVGNLCRLKLNESLFGAPKGPFHIAIPPKDVKNDLGLEYPLPPRTNRLLKTYLDQFRGRLKGGHTDWLFPGEGGNHKQSRTLSEQISRLIKDEIGLEITPHQFRHAAAAWLLEADPGNYELVRRVLGHKRLQTTINFYVGLEQQGAIREYQRRVLGYEDEDEDE